MPWQFLVESHSYLAIAQLRLLRRDRGEFWVPCLCSMQTFVPVRVQAGCVVAVSATEDDLVLSGSM